MTRLVNSLLATACSLVLGCHPSVDPRYYDYSGSDGCNPPNIGHRLGGDLEQYRDNTLEGLRAIAHMQDSRCFKNWEFDLTESADGLVLLHQTQYQGVAVETLPITELPASVVTVDKLAQAFSQVVVTKPIVIDLKSISTTEGTQQAIDLARQLSQSQSVQIWFIASATIAARMPEFCSLLDGKFDVLLYRRGGLYCPANN